MCIRKGKERFGEGDRFWRKTKAHRRGARSNSVYGMGEAVLAGEMGSLCLGLPVHSEV